ncbi:MAG TPA: hypothetical protein VFT23_00245 [Burkholderiales bacterium]|nr:hypothetical protein [Burkholderiales bacterium]
MKIFGWLIVAAAIALIAYAISRWRRRWQEHRRASEERFSAFIAQARPAEVSVPQAVQPAPDASLAPQKLLFEAAAKAAEAGEPALAIQLYARLIARFPESAFTEQARGAVQAQKERLAKP